MSKQTLPIPTDIEYRSSQALLLISFDNDESFELSAEFLRVFSPSAEVRGHGPGQETLQVGKADVKITAIEPVGSYAVKLVFDDGHDSGLYSWDWLYEIAVNKDKLWTDYLDKLQAAGAKRQPDS